MNNDPVSKMDFVADEIEYLDDSANPDDTSDPKLQRALDEGMQMVKELDSIYREALRDKPEALAEWDSIMQEFAAVAAEDEAEKARQKETEAAKVVEGAKLDAEIRAAMDRISADVDQLLALQEPELEVESVLGRSFAAMHELDAVMRLRCRDFPEQMEKWKATMEYLEAVEARFEVARESEKSGPAN